MPPELAGAGGAAGPDGQPGEVRSMTQSALRLSLVNSLARTAGATVTVSEDGNGPKTITLSFRKADPATAESRAA